MPLMSTWVPNGTTCTGRGSASSWSRACSHVGRTVAGVRVDVLPDVPVPHRDPVPVVDDLVERRATRPRGRSPARPPSTWRAGWRRGSRRAGAGPGGVGPRPRRSTAPCTRRSGAGSARTDPTAAGTATHPTRPAGSRSESGSTGTPSRTRPYEGRVRVRNIDGRNTCPSVAVKVRPTVRFSTGGGAGPGRPAGAGSTGPARPPPVLVVAARHVPAALLVAELLEPSTGRPGRGTGLW